MRFRRPRLPRRGERIRISYGADEREAEVLGVRRFRRDPLVRVALVTEHGDIESFWLPSSWLNAS
jgi:hypothetical protein